MPIPQKITIRTDFNKKMSCPYFIHIDIAPKPPCPESMLENTIIEMKTHDGSHAVVQLKLYDLARVPLKDLSETYVKLSHAMTLYEFTSNIMKKYPGISPDTEMGIYFFKHANASA